MCKDVAKSMFFTKESRQNAPSSRIYTFCGQEKWDYNWIPWLALRLLYHDNRGVDNPTAAKFRESNCA